MSCFVVYPTPYVPQRQREMWLDIFHKIRRDGSNFDLFYQTWNQKMSKISGQKIEILSIGEGGLVFKDSGLRAIVATSPSVSSELGFFIFLYFENSNDAKWSPEMVKNGYESFSLSLEEVVIKDLPTYDYFPISVRTTNDDGELGKVLFCTSDESW